MIECSFGAAGGGSFCSTAFALQCHLLTLLTPAGPALDLAGGAAGGWLVEQGSEEARRLEEALTALTQGGWWVDSSQSLKTFESLLPFSSLDSLQQRPAPAAASCCASSPPPGVSLLHQGE